MTLPSIASDSSSWDVSLSPASPVVLIVSADAVMRQTLQTLVNSVGWRLEGFASARAFLSHPRTFVPCCLVLDMLNQDCNGLLFEERLTAERACMSVICVADGGDVPLAVRAMKAGALDVLKQPLMPGALLQAIRHGLRHSEMRLRQEAQIRELHERYASLSSRERQVMALVVSGLLNKQVGGELGITEITVKAHRGTMMRKMKAATFVQLVRMAASLGIAPAGTSA